MLDSIKFKFNDTTYVNNSHASENFYKEDKLIVGSVNSNLENSNHYKSLLRVYISDLNYDVVDSVCLFLFVENIKFATNNNINIGISASINDSHISSISWNTFPKKSTNKQINLSIPYEAVGKYIKIDISSIIKSLKSHSNIYNLTIESINSNSDSIIHFASNNSSNPPYIIITNNAHTEKNETVISDNDNTFSYYSNSNSVNLDTDSNNNEINYDKIFTQLNDQDLKLNLLDKKLKYLGDNISSLNTLINTLDNKIDIFNKNINNTDCCSEKSNCIPDEDISELSQAMHNLSSSLSKISKPIVNLVEIMEIIKIESLDSQS